MLQKTSCGRFEIRKISAGEAISTPCGQADELWHGQLPVECDAACTSAFSCVYDPFLTPNESYETHSVGQ